MSDIYRIAVRLTMESNAPAVLAALSQQLLHVHANVRQLEGGFASLNRAKLAVFGGLGIVAGTGLLGMLKETLKASEELNHQLTNTRTLAANPAKSAAMAAEALGVARNTARDVRGVPLAKAVELYNDSYSIMGAGNAKKVNSVLARYAMVSGGAGGNYEKSFDNLRELLKSGELSGQILDKKTHEVNTDRLLGYLDLAAKASAATDNRINAKTFFQIAQQGGTALTNMNPDGIMAVLMAAQDMGGFRAGTATMSAFSQFVGGTMTQSKAKRLHELGLVGDYSVERGGHLMFKQGALDTDFTKALRKDPLEAIKILRDALTKHGVTGEKQSEEMFKILGRQTVQRLFADWMNGYQQKVDERGRIMGAQGLKQQDATREKNDLGRNVHDFETAWGNLLAELGGPMSRPAIDTLQKMTDGIRYLNDQVVRMGPDNVAKIGTGIGILGAALVGGGGVAILAALGPAGWIAAGIIALGGAVVLLKPDALKNAADGISKLFGAINEGSGKKALDGLASLSLGIIQFVTGLSDKSVSAVIRIMPAIASGVDAFAKGAATLAAEIVSWPAKLVDSIKSMGSQLVAAIGAELRDLVNKLKGYLSFGLFSRTSFGGEGGFGGGGGGGFMNASYTGGGFGGGGSGGGGSGVAGSAYGGLPAEEVIRRAGGGGGFNVRGVINKNPGNIGYGAWAKAHGAIGTLGRDTGHGVAVFPTFEAGYAALADLALSKYRGGRHSIDSLIAGPMGWTPGNHGAAANVARMMGISPFDDAHLDNPATMAKFKAGLSVQELGPAGARYARDHTKRTDRPPTPQATKRPMEIHNNLHVDGKIMARLVTRHQVAEMRHAGGLGSFDDHGMRIAGGQTMHAV